MSARNILEVKHLNRAKILSLLYQLQPVSRIALAKRTGLSAPTVTNIISELIAENIVQESDLRGTSVSRLGRPQQMLTLNAHAKVVLAVHLGFTEARIGLVNLAGEVLASEPIDMKLNAHTTGKELAFVVQQAAQVVTKYGADQEKLLGVGIAVPGLLRHIDVQAIFADAFTLPVYTDWNVRAMTLGEYVFGFNKAPESMVFLHIAQRVGAGVVLHNKIWHGSGEEAGQVGRLSISQPSGPVLQFDDIAAEPALLNMMREFRSAVSDDEGDILEDFLHHLHDDTPWTSAALHEAARRIAHGVTALIDILNPEVIVIGGRIAKADHLLTDALQTALRHHYHTDADQIFSVCMSHLGIDTALIGAAALVLMPEFYSADSAFMVGIST